MPKNNTSFFLCLLVRGTNNTTVPIESCQRSALIFIQRSKNWSTLYCLLSKTYSSFLRPPFKKHSCGQVMPKANTRRCQGKNVRAEQPAVPSPPNSCEENSCDSLEEDAANSPKQPASTENNAQEIYPWMKEFRSKGTKQSHCRSFCPKSEGEQRKWVGIKNNPRSAVDFCTHLFPKSARSKSLEYSGFARTECSCSMCCMLSLLIVAD